MTNQTTEAPPPSARERTVFVDLPLGIHLSSTANDVLNVVTANHSCIAGGFARYCAGLRDAEGRVAGFNDIDIFPLAPPSDTKGYPSPMTAQSKIEIALLHLGYERTNETNLAITLHDKYSDSTVQIVKAVTTEWYASADDVMRDFDFTVCQAALQVSASGDVSIRASEAFTIDEPARRLRFNRMHHPIWSIMRAFKYARRGYTFPPAQIAALLSTMTPEAMADWEQEIARARGAAGPDGLTDTAIEELGYRYAAQFKGVEFNAYSRPFTRSYS